MMLRQWSRRSLSSSLSPLGRRLQRQRPITKSSRERILIGGGGRRSVSTVVNSPWIHNHEAHAQQQQSCGVLSNVASRALSSAAAEEYHPQPRPFKKLMAGE